MEEYKLEGAEVGSEQGERDADSLRGVLTANVT